MKTIAVVSQKGGSGKSTIARHVAAMLPHAGLLDLDPQGTSRRWIDRRRRAGYREPHFGVNTWDKVATIHEKARARNLGHLVIDTPPSHDDERAIRSAIAVADLVIIPSKATPEDMEVLPGIEALIGDTARLYVMTMINPRSNLYTTSRRLLEDRGRVAPIAIANRVAYPEASFLGLTVSEYAASGHAAAEMNALMQFIDRET